MIEKQRYKLNLQTFADDEENDAENDQTQTSFTQEDIDQAVQSAIAEERKRWQNELDNQKSEAEKLANMSEAQKKKYQEEKRLKDLDEREAAINRRELTAQAKDMLADKGLPIELAEILDYKDAETCSGSIEAVSKAFQSAVEKAVENRIKGGEPIKKAPQNTGITVESIKKMSASEINANWDEVQRVLKENR